jgi:hypothetical protein
MELMQWFFMGVLFTLAVIALAYLSMLVKLEWYAWASLIVGAILVLFGFGWAGASFMEGYPQSGSLALIVFSGTGLVMMVLTWRFLVAPLFGQQQK